MTETDMRRKLKEKQKSSGFLFLPIETKGTVLGMPDILYSGNGLSGLIELKILKGKDVIRVPYRPGQRSFLVMHSRRNPRTFVLGWQNNWYVLIDGASRFPDKYDGLSDLVKDVVWSGAELDDRFLDILSMEESWNGRITDR